MELSIREQMLASVSGAGITALTMTPFDVVKVRSQMSSKPKIVNYCNGLMDHLICCREPYGKVSRDCFIRPGILGGAGCRVIQKHALVNARHCIDQSKCISTQECLHLQHRTFTRARPTVQPWYTRCPVSEKNTFRAMVHLARTEGPSTLWAGLPATLTMALPSTVMYFTAYEIFKKKYSKIFSNLESSFLAGCTARFLSATLISPLELIRTRMQVDGQSLKEVLRVTSESVQTAGIRTLFLGYSATILRDVPFSGIYFCCYEFSKPYLRLINSLSIDSQNFIAAGGAAAIAGTLTLPFDVIKTRQQMLLGDKLVGSSKISFISTYKHIVTTDGPRALLAGFGPRLLKVIPACAIMMSSYEFTKRYFIARQRDQRF